MSTTRYKEWLTAYDKGKFKPTTKLGVMLVTDNYVPEVTDKKINVKYIVATIPDALTWAEFQANGMSGIVEKLQARSLVHISKNQKIVDDAVTSAYLSKEEEGKTPEAKALTVEKSKKVKESLRMVDEIKEVHKVEQKFRELKDGGIAYMVTYCTEFNVICFCESINE